MTIGDRIREKRKNKDYTLEQLADEIGVTKSTVLKYENGSIAIPSDKIEKIENNSFNKNRLQIDEVVKNIINYFTKSETGYLNFEDNERIEYFSKSRVSILYKKIYEENYEKIVNKYSILSTKKIKFENVLNEDYNELSEVKKELYDYL